MGGPWDGPGHQLPVDTTGRGVGPPTGLDLFDDQSAGPSDRSAPAVMTPRRSVGSALVSVAAGMLVGFLQLWLARGGIGAWILPGWAAGVWILGRATGLRGRSGYAILAAASFLGYWVMTSIGPSVPGIGS
jgi:hypothetical protein